MYLLKRRTFVLASWMCEKNSSVSHSSAESEIISMDAGLRLDGVPSLDLWDMVIEVLRSTNNNVQPNHDGIRETGANLHSRTKTQKIKRRQKVDQCSDGDYVPTNTHFFSRRVSVVHF